VTSFGDRANARVGPKRRTPFTFLTPSRHTSHSDIPSRGTLEKRLLITEAGLNCVQLVISVESLSEHQKCHAEAAQVESLNIHSGGVLKATRRSCRMTVC
jgi:hypothetical protein